MLATEQKRAIKRDDMAWKTYRIVFRLRSPLHIGWGKAGNLQRTRPYVMGRTLWGALTMRLTRDALNGKGLAADSQQYQKWGEEVHKSLAYTYFYVATKAKNGYHITWPWQNESLFRRRFLGSYSSTALIYPHHSAAEGTLHEVEFISPRTSDTGEPVFFMGYFFERDGCNIAWREACHRLQLGGERGYGWGALELIEVTESSGDDLFDGMAGFSAVEENPVISLSGSPAYLLAHTHAADLGAAGEVEPLVGREWRSHNTRNRHAGQHVEFSGVCFAPGSVVIQPLSFLIGEFGVWEIRYRTENMS
jgi:hypothetical protein